MTLKLTSPIAAYVTVVLTTLAALELGNLSLCYGSSTGSASSGSSNKCYYFRSCLLYLAEYERLISGGNISFSEVELEDACNKHDDIKVCVRRAQTTCVAGPHSMSGTAASAYGGVDYETEELLRAWIGLNASLSYLCRDVKTAVLRYNKGCYGQPHLLSSTKKCNKTFHMEKELFAVQNNDDVCGLTKSLLKCLYEKTMLHCHDAVAANILTTAVQLLQQPRLDSRRRAPCALGDASVLSPSSRTPVIAPGLLLIVLQLVMADV